VTVVLALSVVRCQLTENLSCLLVREGKQTGKEVFLAFKVEV